MPANLPIQRKLVRFIGFVTLAMAVISYVFLLAYETRSSKQITTRHLITVGGIIAANSTAALIYDDPALAAEILAGLRADPGITAAALYDRRGGLYAAYPASLTPDMLPPRPLADGADFNFHRLTVFQPVLQQGNRVGTLYLHSDLEGLYRRLVVYGFTLLAVLTGAAVLTYYFSTFLQRRISRPILALADAARLVTERKDYSVRVKREGHDELGTLTQAFNAMLDQIQLNLAALRESEQRFRLAADSSPVLIWLADEHAGCVWLNRPWLDFVGRPLEAQQGAGWRENLHPDDRARYDDAATTAFAARRGFRLEYRLRRHDGAFRWVLDQGVPRLQDAQFAGFVGSCVDIHDRKEAEAAARSSELQMRLVTDHASVFLAQLDRDARFKFVNRAYAERYGRQPHQLVGRHLSEIVGPEVYELCRARIASALAGHREEFELEAPYADLGTRWIHLVCVPERDLDGHVVGFVAALTDMTERRRAELSLERARDEALAASRAKDDFLAALSHELRTPLNPVLLIASEAATDPALPAAVRAEFETIRKNVELEARLIDDLLDLTTITRGKLTLKLRPTDVHTVLRDAVATVRAEILAKHLEFHEELGDAEPVVLGDPVRLQQVFWNVLKNAMKFTPHGGRITLGTAESPARNTFLLRVADTGIGLSPEEMGRIFEAFTQGDHAVAGGSHRFGGLGLGLAISRQIIALHGGTITVSSPGPNLGCTFTIELPLVRPPADGTRAVQAGARPARSSADPFPPPTGPTRSVLLVEDHAPTRAALEQLLTRRRYLVVAAGSVEEARAAAAAGKFDLVVSDIGLPDGTGYELMAHLRARYGLKGIALTGYGMEGDLAQSRHAGFEIHLVKPVRVQALDEALASVAGRGERAPEPAG